MSKKLREFDNIVGKPEPGTKVIVITGGQVTSRRVEGEVVRSTPTIVIVRYKPSVKFPGVVEERFFKRHGRRVGDGYKMSGPCLAAELDQ